jgi:hypothetical protein
MSRESTKAALDRFFSKQAKHDQRIPRKNQKPEFTNTVVPCLEWLRSNGWSVDIVEAKATYSAQAGRYLSGPTEAGMPDLVGCAPDGIGAFIEAKAKGKRSTVRPQQHAYLTEKISKGAFAVVVDSVEDLERQYLAWASSPGDYQKQYLLEQLPKLAKRYQEPAPDPELGF